MSLGNVIAEMLKTENEFKVLTPRQTEEIIETFVLKVSEPIQDSRSERKVSNEDLALIRFRRKWF